VAAAGELVADQLPAVLGEATSLPDPVLGLLEDVGVLALAAQATRGRDADTGADVPAGGQPALSGSAPSGSA